MITGKHVLVLMASVTTGFTAKRSIEAIGYYGGHVAGVAAIYSAVEEVGGLPRAQRLHHQQTCPATRATTTGTAPTARPVRSWTPWSTASAIPRCNGDG